MKFEKHSTPSLTTRLRNFSTAKLFDILGIRQAHLNFLVYHSENIQNRKRRAREMF
jgi:hypothetical protein